MKATSSKWVFAGAFPADSVLIFGVYFQSGALIPQCSFLWNSPLMAPGDITQTGVVRLRSLQLKGPMPTGTCPWFRLATFLATLTRQTHPPSSATCLVCCTSSAAVTRWSTWSTTLSWPRKSDLASFLTPSTDSVRACEEEASSGGRKKWSKWDKMRMSEYQMTLK